MRKRLLIVAAAVLAVAFGSAPPAGLADPGAGHIRHAGGVDAVPGRYLVVLKPGANLANVYSGQTHHVFETVLNGFSATMSEAAAKRLSTHPSVSYVQQSHLVRQTGEQTNPPSWGLDRSDQISLPLNQRYSYPNDGAGVRVYVMDSGIRLTHTDLSGRTVDGPDFTSETDNTSNECTTNGHGTHVAGTIAGTSYGIAKRATVVALQTVGCGGSGPDDDLVEAIDWVTANAQKPAVVNISLTADVADHAVMNQAIRNSVASGVVYAIAAGNHGDNACNHSPSRVTEALIVGGSDNDDTIRDGTNTGSCIDVFAPGGNIVSLNSNSDTGTSTRSGTSMSSPHVAGAAALVLSANPSFTPAQVEQRIIEKSSKDRLTQIGTSPNRLLNVTGLGGGSDDTTPPTTPGNLRSTGRTSSSVSLAWDASTDNVGVIGYDVYIGGLLATTVLATAATVGGLAADTPYEFTVRAKDAAGNASTPAGPVTVRTDPGSASGVTNGGFEAGNLSGWTASGNAAVVGSPVQAGTKAARLGPVGTSALSQIFTAVGGQLSLWYKMDCSSWAFGSFKVTLRDNVTGATTNLVNRFCATTAYQQVTGALTVGRSYTLTITQVDSSWSGATASTLVDSING